MGWEHLKSLAGFGALLFAGPVCLAGVSPPPAVLDGLVAESFPRRVEAQAELAQWAEDAGDAGLDWLVRTSAQDRDPEIRNRAYSVLRETVLAQLESRRPGFIGVTMVGAEVAFDEAALPCVQVTSVQPKSPADIAGLRQGDAVIGIDGDRWVDGDTPDQLARKVGGMAPGRKIRLEVIRDGEKKEFSLSLAARPWSAGEWGELRQMRIDPFGGVPSFGPSEDEAREDAFRRWLEERADPEAKR